MADFKKAHEFTQKWEGGISDHPNDAGGYTAYGVSTAFMNDLYNSRAGREFLAGMNISGPITRAVMKRIGKEEAAKIFCHYFWNGQNIGFLPDQGFALAWYDASVNHGKAGAARMVQQALNNKRKAGLVVDGIAGPLTHKAAMAADKDCSLELCRIRANFFENLAAKKPSQKVFLKGWLNRVNDLKKLIVSM